MRKALGTIALAVLGIGYVVLVGIAHEARQYRALVTHALAEEGCEDMLACAPREDQWEVRQLCAEVFQH